MHTSPKVSLIIPVYNWANYLTEAIDSALAQDYDNYEIIVINDGSNDNGATDAIARSYEDKIRYFSKKNGGVATALNLAVEKAEGEYISWLSHDDVYFPNKLSRQVDFLLKLPLETRKSTILSSDIEIINEASRPTWNHRYKYIAGDILYELLMRGVISWCTLLIPKSAFVEAGGFDPTLKTTQDYHLWLRFIRAGYRFEHISEILVKSRAHAEQDSQKKASLAAKERLELERFAFSIFSAKDFATGSRTNKNAMLLIIKIKTILWFKRAIPRLVKLTKDIGIYDYIAPLYIKHVLKK